MSRLVSTRCHVCSSAYVCFVLAQLADRRVHRPPNYLGGPRQWACLHEAACGHMPSLAQGERAAFPPGLGKRGFYSGLARRVLFFLFRWYRWRCWCHIWRGLSDRGPRRWRCSRGDRGLGRGDVGWRVASGSDTDVVRIRSQVASGWCPIWRSLSVV